MNFRQKKNIAYELGSLKRVLFDLPGCVYWKDRNGVYLGCNKAFLEMVGLDTVDKVIGKTDKDFCWSLEEPTLIKNDQKVMKFGRASFEETVTLSDKAQLTYTVVKSPLYDAFGNIIGTIGTSLDITQQKKFQQELEKAKDKAETANKAKSEFLANMSHDVKTPLSGMVAISELLMPHVQEDYRSLTQDMLDAGKHLMSFFENCIELSKIESGSIINSEEVFSIKELLDEISQLFRPTVRAKGLEIYVDYSEVIPDFYGNRINLYRIILNLVGNSIKFTHQGSITIRAEFNQQINSELGKLKLSIIDTGIGIAKDKQSIIFERFSRLNPAYEGTYEGSGIGLYIVQKFVKEMGGEISVESEKGKGSQFTIILPLQVASSSHDRHDLSTTILENTIKIATKEIEVNTQPSQISLNQETKIRLAFKPNILLVEDNLVAQKGARALLSGLGCHVDIANCGEEALNLFQPGKYQLVFLDIGLPDMKGYAVSAQFRDKEKSASYHTPILGLSAHAKQDERKLSLGAGMEEVLSKPLLSEQAKKLLSQYVFSQYLSSEDGHNNHQPVENSHRGSEKIIDLEGNGTDIHPSQQDAWELVHQLMSLMPEMRAEIELAYKLGDKKLLIERIHQMHGGLCYTNTPDLLQATQVLEASLKNGDMGIEALYQDFLQAIDRLDEVYSAKITKNQS